MADRIDGPSRLQITPFALVGFGAWAGVGLLALGPAHARFDLVDVVFLLGPLVIVPIGLDLISIVAEELPGGARGWLSLAQFLWPFGAGAAVLSLLLSGGWPAGLFSLVWGGVATMAAIAGGLWLIGSRVVRLECLAPAAATIYLAIGAAWLVVSRFGLNPFGLSDDRVLITAVHFTFVGFGGVLVTWLPLQRLVLGSLVRAAGEAASIATIVGMPLVVAGVASAPFLSAIGGVLLALGLPVAAAITAFAIARLRLPQGSWLLFAVSCASSVFAMALAAQYSVGVWLHLSVLSVRRMIEWHGVVNGFGFVLLGLVGWSLGVGALARGRPRTPQGGAAGSASAIAPP
jgi:hypothetical protein